MKLEGLSDFDSVLGDEVDARSVGSMKTAPIDRGSYAVGHGHEQSDSIAVPSARKGAAQECSNRTMGPNDDDDGNDEDNDDDDIDEDEREEDGASDEENVEGEHDAGKHRGDSDSYRHAAGVKQGTIDLKEAELSIRKYSRVAYETVCGMERTIHACIVPAKRPNGYTFKAFEVNGAIKTVQFEYPKPAHYKFRAHLIEMKRAKDVSFEDAWNDVLKNGNLDIRVEIVKVKEDQEGGFSELEFKMTGPRAAESSREPAPMQARERPARMSASATRGPKVTGPTAPADGTAVKMGVDPVAELQERWMQHYKETFERITQLTKENEEVKKANTELRAKCNELTGKRKADETIECHKKRRDEYKERLHESEAARVADKARLAEQADKLDAYADKYGPL